MAQRHTAHQLCNRPSHRGSLTLEMSVALMDLYVATGVSFEQIDAKKQALL